MPRSPKALSPVQKETLEAVKKAVGPLTGAERPWLTANTISTLTGKVVKVKTLKALVAKGKLEEKEMTGVIQEDRDHFFYRVIGD